MNSKDPYRYFRIEARELLDEMSSAMLRLETDTAPGALVARLLRLAHTLKGAARVVRQVEIAGHAHAIEDALAPWRERAQPLPAEVLNPLLGRVDQMAALLARLDEAEPAQREGEQTEQASATAAASPAAKLPAAMAPGAAGATSQPGEDLRKSLRAGSSEALTAVLEGIACSHVRVASLREHLDATQRAAELVDMLLSQLGKGRHRAGLPRAPLAQDVAVAHDMAEELRSRIHQLDTALSRTTEQLDRDLRQTRDTAEQLQLVPARQLFPGLARTVWDVAQLQGKEASLACSGGDVRLEVDMLATLQPALLQLIRNAVAHGIEPPAQRQAAGKPAAGRVAIEVVREGSRVHFVCTDDGAGIDAEAVMRAASRQGLPAIDASQPDTAQLARLLLGGGLSTATSVTEASGRGIGLNVVKDVLDKLGGQVQLQTTPGQGTAWRLSFPMHRAVIAVLCVEADGVPAMLPLDAIVHTRRLPSTDLIAGSEGWTMVHDGQTIPFMSLHHALGRPASAQERPAWSTVIFREGARCAALGVDRLSGVAHIVMQPLPDLAPASPGIAGVTLDVAGRPQLVLDPGRLMAMALDARDAHAAQAAPERLPILVIDDSLTTRMLEQSILMSAGHRVHTANSAEEGLDKVRTQPYALLLVDVDMPGMDGFGLVQALRDDPALRHIPAILVTSRDAEQDMRRGREVGADGYIVKGDFAQGPFLSMVRQLIERGRPA